MFVARNEVKYFLPAEEKQAISYSLLDPWVRICVQSGGIRRVVELHVYSVGSLVIEAKSKLMVLLVSENLDDGTELFRVAVVSDQKKLQEMLSRMRPSIDELMDVPDDLEMGLFLGVENDVSLLRFYELLGEEVGRIKAATESGLLISNSNSRLLLYPNEEIPLEFCITTDTEKIDSILSKADIVSFS